MVYCRMCSSKGEALICPFGTSAPAAKQRDGQIGEPPVFSLVQPPLQKYFCFSEYPNQSIFAAIPSHSEGRLAIVTNAGRDAVDAGGA